MNPNNRYLQTMAFITILSIILFAGCGGDEEKNPDLLYEFADLVMQEVDSGDPLILESSITNEADNCTNCTTMTSGECARSIRVEYRPDENSPWVDAELQDQGGNTTFELVKPVPEIEESSNYTQSEGFVFLTPGLYRYKLVADRNFEVEERIETNNDASTEDGDVRAQGSSSPFKLIVRVYDPSGQNKPSPAGKKPAPILYLGNL